ncbi:glycosyltransferase family 4 protein [Salicibibacter cibi]|uniref:Glycosyltransferase family 4 protein n=1 Tax=Salicibibacter cibi TaxID=2743001 RepID=A0A7T6ZBQ6_9BACI|nr:glycosyltransferase family 4 protein [Salicibibacter cibi]QQK80452.1 glycosyltransferase family 4 protein [Salicibibacter cibi]
MDILYLAISYPKGHDNLYKTLMKSLVKRGHSVTVVVADEPRKINKTTFQIEDGINVLRVKVGNQLKANRIEKGITNLKIEPFVIRAIKKYLSNEAFDIVTYSTPPVNMANVVKYCKERFQVRTFLMLKDIFPQNAVDMGMIKEGNLLYKYFKRKERTLYNNSDIIGCMSQANINYILRNNPEVDEGKVILFPNSIKIQSDSVEPDNPDLSVREELGIPKEKTVFVFGGNLGKPQGIDFLTKAINNLEDYKGAYFVIVGSGTEKRRIENKLGEATNTMVLDKMEKEKYERFITECDVGIISLDHRFTIPNYPSRTLSYMYKSLPILATTDRNTDIKELVQEEAECGVWCHSDDVAAFRECVVKLSENKNLRRTLGQNGRSYLEENFSVDKSVDIIEHHFA